MSNSFKSGSSSSHLSESSDPKTGCASLDCPKDESLKSKSATKKQQLEDSTEEDVADSSSPEV